MHINYMMFLLLIYRVIFLEIYHYQEIASNILGRRF